MTAMDVFADYRRRGERIRTLEERIRRREATAEVKSSARSLEDGSRGGTDGGNRMLDYVGNIEALREELRACRSAREEDRLCALYLADMMPEAMGGVMTRAYLEEKAIRDIAREMCYSESHIKRLKREATAMCEQMQLMYWDRVHVPVVSRGEG